MRAHQKEGFSQMYCPNCRQTIPDGSVFCLHCGTDLKTISDRGAGSSKHSSRPGLVAGLSIGALALLVVLALIVGILVVAYVYNESSKSKETSQPRRVVAQDNPVRQPESVETSQPRPVIAQDNPVRQPQRVS